MEHKLFFANLPDDVTEEQLRAVCAEYGEVESLSLVFNVETKVFTEKARVTLETEEELEPLLVSLNSQRIGDRRLAVSRAEPPEPWPKITGEQQAAVQQIVDALGEEVGLAQRSIKRILLLCGTAFAQEMLADTLRIEEQGGLWLERYNRQRTPGGVYLHLARQWLSPQSRRVVFPDRKNKPKSKAKSPKAETVSATTDAPAAVEAGEPALPVADKQSHEVSEPVAQNVIEPAAAIDEQAAREQLAALQQAYQVAQTQLAAVKAGQAGPGVSAMALMKEIVDTQRAISDFLDRHPHLA